MLTLFGHIAAQHAFPENIATEALAFILRESAVARGAIVDLLRPIGVELKSELEFVTQDAGPDGAIPDLVGRDSTGRITLIFESKFWASLTDRQPLAYLDRLPAGQPALLIFVAPSARIVTLWPELRRRCATLPCENDRESEHLCFTHVGGKRYLALISWRSLLEHLEQKTQAASEPERAADVRQLRGLCERMDSKAFLPIRSEELSPSVPRRLLQFMALVNDVAERLKAMGLAKIQGRASRPGGRYVRFIVIRGNGCRLYFSPYAWADDRETPIWLGVGNARWQATPELRQALRAIEAEQPSRLLTANDQLRVPIFLPFGVERDAVIDSIVQQVKAIAELLPISEQPATEPPAESAPE